MALPLENITVIDLTRFRSGPTCVRQLADMGANVIQITAGRESASTFGPRSSDYLNLHRNKRSLTLNLKDERGCDILRQLVSRADVLVENYRPDVKHRLGIDYDALSKINPRLIYGSISGFGQDGPYRNRPGYDQIAQGLGGLMSITGAPGQGPMRVGIPVADLTAGIFLAQGILVALYERETSGKGQWVTTSLLQAMVHMLDFQATRWLIDGELPPQAGNNHPTTYPTGAFATRTGDMNIAAATTAQWRALCDVLDAPQLLDDPRFARPADRSRNRDDLADELNPRIAAFDRDDLIQKLNDAGVPAGPILNIAEVFDNEQVRAINASATVQHHERGELEILAPPYTLSRTPGGLRTASPDPGQHSDEILAELGYDAQQCAALREAGVT